jgi:hypothetical protein
MKSMIYIVSSPFQFYVALLDFYDNNYKKGEMIFIRYKSDKNNYQEMLKSINIQNLNFQEFYVDDIAMLQKKHNNLKYKMSRRFKKINLFYKIYKKYKRFNQFTIKIGDRGSFEQLFLAKLVGEKRIEFMGDGASLVFDKDLKINLSFFKRILFFIFNLPNPNELQTKNYDFFLRKSNFISNFYTQLPIKNEIWLFGQTNYFIEPNNIENYNKYTQEAIKQGIWFNCKNQYFELLKHIKEKYHNQKIYYFPHRNEIVFDEIKELFPIANFCYFSEILPIMLGYLPKTIIGTSTTIFSYSKINLHLDKKVDLIYFPITKSINQIYEKYGAKNLLEILN